MRKSQRQSRSGPDRSQQQPPDEMYLSAQIQMDAQDYLLPSPAYRDQHTNSHPPPDRHQASAPNIGSLLHQQLHQLGHSLPSIGLTGLISNGQLQAPGS